MILFIFMLSAYALLDLPRPVPGSIITGKTTNECCRNLWPAWSASYNSRPPIESIKTIRRSLTQADFSCQDTRVNMGTEGVRIKGWWRIQCSKSTLMLRSVRPVYGVRSVRRGYCVAPERTVEEYIRAEANDCVRLVTVKQAYSSILAYLSPTTDENVYKSPPRPSWMSSTGFSDSSISTESVICSEEASEVETSDTVSDYRICHHLSHTKSH